MLTTPTVPTPEFLRNIESAIIEDEVIACPSLECTSKLVSKKKMSPENVSYLEYYCLNSDCWYHQKRKIILEAEPEKESSSILNFSSEKITLALGIFLAG